MHEDCDWDLESTSSLESNLFTLNNNLKTISHLITKVIFWKYGIRIYMELDFYANFSLYAQLFQDDSTEKLFQLEPNAPSTLVTCIFASCYFSLGNQFYRDESIKGLSIIQSLNGKIRRLNSNYRNRRKTFPVMLQSFVYFSPQHFVDKRDFLI